jgi:hypothetical protein
MPIPRLLRISRQKISLCRPPQAKVNKILYHKQPGVMVHVCGPIYSGDKGKESQFEANLDKDNHENLSEIKTKESKRIKVWQL